MKEQVQILRKETGAGLLDCKMALVKCNGNMESAKELLKEKLGFKLINIIERATQEGSIMTYIHATKKIGATVVLNCETDFVARNEVFQTLGNDIALHITACAPEDTHTLLAQPFIKDTSITVGDYIDTTIAKTGENIVVSHFQRFEV